MKGLCIRSKQMVAKIVVQKLDHRSTYSPESVKGDVPASEAL